jgi:hypothetical protein
MKKTFISILLILSLLGSALSTSSPGRAASAACVPGPHSGSLTVSQTWCAADSPHQLTGGNVTIEAGDGGGGCGR